MARERVKVKPDEVGEVPPAVNGQLIPSALVPGSRLIPLRETPLNLCPTNIDASDRAGRAKMFNAAKSALLDLGPNGEITLEVSHWLVHWRQGVDEESGEVKDYPVLVVLTPSGDATAFTSEVVLHGWADLLAMEGNGPWEPPLCIQVRARTARRTRRTYHELRIVG